MNKKKLDFFPLKPKPNKFQVDFFILLKCIYHCKWGNQNLFFKKYFPQKNKAGSKCIITYFRVKPRQTYRQRNMLGYIKLFSRVNIINLTTT